MEPVGGDSDGDECEEHAAVCEVEDTALAVA